MSDPTQSPPESSAKSPADTGSESPRRSGGNRGKPKMTPEQAKKQAAAQRRFALLLLPPIIIVVLLGLNVFREIQSAPPWRDDLSSFMNEAYGVENIDDALTASDQAASPANLQAENSFRSVGESAYYVTDESPAAAEVGTDSRSPLPYPPEEIWCFRTDRISVEEQFILFARHQDMDNADWLIHLPRDGVSQADIDQTLTDIGCDLTLTEEATP